MKPSVEIVYEVLTGWARDFTVNSYKDLSSEYYSLTGVVYNPHGSWDSTLGELNSRLASVGAPALSAVVILHRKNEPGFKFWGSAKNVPSKPVGDEERLRVWLEIVKAVRDYPWPKSLAEMDTHHPSSSPFISVSTEFRS